MRFVLAALLAVFSVAPGAVAQIAPQAGVFDYIDAADIASGRIEIDGTIDDEDPNVGASICALNRGQIGRLVTVLKRARGLKDLRDGLGAVMVIRFERPGQTDLVAVIASPEEEGADTEIYFGGRLAVIDPASLAEVRAVAEEAGCGAGE